MRKNHIKRHVLSGTGINDEKLEDMEKNLVKHISSRRIMHMHSFEIIGCAQDLVPFLQI